MYTICDFVACVVLIFTLSTMLFGLGVVLLTIEWGIESLGEVGRNSTGRFALFLTISRSCCRAGRCQPMERAVCTLPEMGGKYGLPITRLGN